MRRRVAPLLLALLVVLAMRGSRALPLRGAAPVLRVVGTSFALSVPDLGASERWYRDRLGLVVLSRFPRTDATRTAGVVLGGGGLMVELLQREDDVPLRTLLPGGTPTSGVHGIAKVGVVVDDFDDVLATLRARDVEIAFGPFPRRVDQPANVIVRDLDGNLIQIAGR